MFLQISFYDMTDSRELASIDETNFDPSALGSLKTLHASFSYRALTADQGDTLRLIMESKAEGAYLITVVGLMATQIAPALIP